MGFWLGTVFFVALELLGMFLVKSLIGTRQGRRHELLGQLLVATSVICCWLLWVIVYMGQMKVCIRYGCLTASPPSLAASNHHGLSIHTNSPHTIRLIITDSRWSTPSCRREGFLVSGPSLSERGKADFISSHPLPCQMACALRSATMRDRL
jgi:hypothetical protein